MKKLTILLFSLIIFSSCNNNTSNNDYIRINREDFKEVKLHGEIMNLDTIWNPLSIHLKDSLLFIINRSGDYFVQTFNLNNNNFLTYNVPSGLGPNESVQCNFIFVTDDYVMAAEPHFRLIRKYKYDDFVTTIGCLPIEEIQFDQTITSFIQNNNGNLITSLYSNNDTMLCEFDTKLTSNIKYAPYPNVLYPEFSLEHNWSNYLHSTISYNSHRDKIVIAYSINDMIDIYNSDLTLYKRIIGPMNLPHKGDIERDTYPCCASTSDYIMALYSGKPIEADEEYSNEIFVFDYEGNPIKIFNLDTQIFNFCIDENKKCIYAVTPEFSVVKFKYE
ncbi:MAG: TolB-like 6-bladed beta-propeller domain-containing protein [Bacteroidales bacterium]|nr:TolB-like 6-bladed beta-propeller domain-containing protein [Bacteroidales bacterium]